MILENFSAVEIVESSHISICLFIILLLDGGRVVVVVGAGYGLLLVDLAQAEGVGDGGSVVQAVGHIDNVACESIAVSNTYQNTLERQVQSHNCAL